MICGREYGMIQILKKMAGAAKLNMVLILLDAHQMLMESIMEFSVKVRIITAEAYLPLMS